VLKRADGQPITELDLEMQAVPVETAIKSYPFVMRRKGDAWVLKASDETRRHNARLIPFSATGFGRTRLSPQTNRWLMETWRHLTECDCGTLSDLAADHGRRAQRKDRVTCPVGDTHSAIPVDA